MVPTSQQTFVVPRVNEIILPTLETISPSCVQLVGLLKTRWNEWENLHEREGLLLKELRSYFENPSIASSVVEDHLRILAPQLDTLFADRKALDSLADAASMVTANDIKSIEPPRRSPIRKRKREEDGPWLSEENDFPQPPAGSRKYSGCRYVDITDLLMLPQKEAATHLGISESMLCKRFKECTRRKWPYRYVQKIDKVINMTRLQYKGHIPPEEEAHIEQLLQEREECLQPVKIRITVHDQDPNQPVSPRESCGKRLKNEEENSDIEFDADEQSVLMTLGMMKSAV